MTLDELHDAQAQAQAELDKWCDEGRATYRDAMIGWVIGRLVFAAARMRTISRWQELQYWASVNVFGRSAEERERINAEYKRISDEIARGLR